VLGVTVRDQVGFLFLFLFLFLLWVIGVLGGEVMGDVG